MSEAKEKLDRFIVARMRKLWARMSKPGMPLLEQARLSREVDLLGRRLLSKTDPTTEEVDAIASIERLEARQGTVLPDFQALYEKKAKLDRSFFDRDQQETPPT